MPAGLHGILLQGQRPSFTGSAPATGDAWKQRLQTSLMRTLATSKSAQLDPDACTFPCRGKPLSRLNRAASVRVMSHLVRSINGSRSATPQVGRHRITLAYRREPEDFVVERRKPRSGCLAPAGFRGRHRGGSRDDGLGVCLAVRAREELSYWGDPIVPPCLQFATAATNTHLR